MYFFFVLVGVNCVIDRIFVCYLLILQQVHYFRLRFQTNLLLICTYLKRRKMFQKSDILNII